MQPFATHTAPYIVAGPCSIESRLQFAESVDALSQIPQVAMIRCGVWKPRTQPGSFEGRGEEALQWIQDVKKQHPNLLFATEVATPQHLELSLKYGIDAVWIGARTSGNPFSVSELCSALQGCRLPVMVKNPLIPDIKLWTGAIDRVLNSGISAVAAVHRGFYLDNNLGYRNNPLWKIPIELKRQHPDLPLFCDPSHISGQARLVAKVAQTAMDLNFDGLMIETHPHPQQALTDADQQLNPAQLSRLIANLRIPDKNNTIPNELQLLRQQIDIIDGELLRHLADRNSVSQKIASIKQANNLPILQLDRWEQLLGSHLAEAAALGLSEDFVRRIFEEIHSESVRLQDDALNGVKR